MNLSPGVRPAVCGLVVRAKRTIYYRYLKSCLVCRCQFTARNDRAITCSPRCRQAYKRLKAKVAAAQAAAAQKHKKGGRKAAPRKKAKR